MIVDKKVLVSVSGRNKNYYENKGYKLPYEKDKRGRIGIKKGSKIFIDINDLREYSQVKIKYKCDSCGEINSVHAQTILGRTNSQYKKTSETFCSKCANKKMAGINKGLKIMLFRNIKPVKFIEHILQGVVTNVS